MASRFHDSRRLLGLLQKLLAIYLSLEIAVKLLFRKKILFLVRYPGDNDLADGFFRRVKAIDDLSTTTTRIYFSGVSKRTYLRAKGDFVYEAAIGRSRVALFYMALIALTATVYCHSVLALGGRSQRLLFRLGLRRVWDVHGIVPEELSLFSSERKESIRFNRIERIAFWRSTRIVSVSKSMSHHLLRKYNVLSETSTQRFLIYPNWPVISLESIYSVALKKADSSVIYAGGIQKWQRIERMFEFARQWGERLEMLFLVPDAKALKTMYRDIYAEEMPFLSASADPGEIGTHYRRFAYGLVLRDSSIVNKVACPTKLCEYMANGVLPVVESADIGDFLELGYQYISIDNFEPLSEQEWRRRVAINLKLILSYKAESSRDATSVAALLGG